MSDLKQHNVTNRLLSDIAWVIFWTMVGTICLLLKARCTFKQSIMRSFDFERAGFRRIGFCENGAGYGGAIISLVAFIEKIPSPFEPVLYTSIRSEQYARLGGLCRWRHLPCVRLVHTARLAQWGIPFISTLDNCFNLLPTAARYYLAFRRDKVDCVYLNNDASCNFAAAIAAHFAGLPLILHARGFNCDTRGNRWVLSKSHHCIAVSHAVRDELLELGVLPEHCTVVAEGLDLSVFCPKLPSAILREELKLDTETPVITLVGGLVDWKGQDVMLDAAPMIFKDFPNAVILLVGGAYGRDNEFADMITERAKAPAMQGRVRLLGERDDVADVLACSNVVVHASTKPEPFGRTFLEGMALGKAVIASNEGGPLDVISHGSDGLLVEPRNPAVLAAAITAVLGNRQLLSKLGYNAASKAVAYSIENHSSRISQVLRKVLQLENGLPEVIGMEDAPDGYAYAESKQAA